MATTEKNGTARAKEKAARFKRFYWVLGTIVVAAVLFTFYYSVYVSSQQTYYNERAFRLLSSMADRFSLQVRIAGNVLRASASFPDANTANDYIHTALHGKIQDHDYTITNWHKADSSVKPSRQGTLTLFMPESANSFRVRADYREMFANPGDAEETKEIAAPDKPCGGARADISLCAAINFDPLIRPSFHDLEEGFFDDVLVADSEGNVLYQESSQGIRIQNISGLQFSLDNAGSGSSLLKLNASSSAATGANTPHSFASLIQTSGQATIQLAGSEYALFFQPLSVSLKQGEQERRLVLCGLRTEKHAHAQTLVLPYTYLLWSVLILLTIFALGWPVLKFYYMSPKERLQSRQILYLLASILLATALVTLIALNASYQLTSDDMSRRELIRLARQINTNFTQELSSAMNTLDTLSVNPSVLKLVGDDANGNRADFLEHQGELCKDCQLSYPYFRFFFLASKDGSQIVKYTVNHESTPWTNVKEEPFFHPVMDGDLDQFQLLDGTRQLRMDPLFSPNTGEFLVTLAAPWSGADAAPQQRNRATVAYPKTKNPVIKVLAIKVESLVKPVLPTGFGFAVVAPDGKVLFHSSAVRNLNEDFIKEARGDVSLQALLAQGSTGVLDINYLGTKKKMWITPLQAAIHPRLTLVVFKDVSDTTTMNMAVVVVFSVLVMCYAILPVFLVVLVHVVRRKEYPLEVIWPNCSRRSHYLHLVVANIVLSAAYFQRYVFYGLTRALITVLAVALVAALYPFLECRKYLRTLANVLVVIAVVVASGLSWVLGIAVLFAVYAFYTSLGEAIDRWLLGRFSLKLTYTFAAASLLMILVVVPGAGFFKVSYDFVHKLFVQSRQLDLAERLEQRRQYIGDFYAHLSANPSFERKRQLEEMDRYDKLFLNCPVIGQDSPRDVSSSFVERGILDLTSYFPLNPFAAQLEALARTRKDIPGHKWQVVDTDVFGQRTCHPRVLAASGMRLAPSDPGGHGDLGEAIFTPVPIWPALDWRVRLWLMAAIAGLAGWIHFVPRRLFLLDLESLPPLDEWKPQEKGLVPHLPQNILLLGHPKSGKGLTIKKFHHAHLLDFAEMATTGKWDLPADCPKVVALNHFEFGIDDAELNMKKLRTLEELIHVRHRRIILLSTIDPLYYLNAGCPDVVVPGDNKSIAAAIDILDRWAVVLTPFRKVTIEDITIQGFYRVAQQLRNKREDLEFHKFIDLVVEECDHTAQLRKMGAAILRAYRKDEGLSKEQLIQELLDRADSYYRVLWSTCTQDERLVLYQLARDGWANLKNTFAIQHLQRRKLIVVPAQVSARNPWAGNSALSTLKGPIGIRIMNESFRQFIRISQQRDEIEAWEREGDQSVWRFLKLSLGILAVAGAAWLLYSQQQFFNLIVAYVGALGAAAGVVFKLVSDLRGKNPAPAG